MANFPTRTPVVAHLDLFLLSGASISSMGFSQLGNSEHIVVSMSIDFPSSSKGNAPFHCIAYDCSCANWYTFAAASEIFTWVQVRINVHQVKLHSWFSAACATAIADRNHFFCLFQQSKSSESIVKFRQDSNHCKKILPN